MRVWSIQPFDGFGGTFQIPHYVEPRQELQDQIIDVELPPEKAVARRDGPVVVVVVPTVAQGEQGYDDVVAAIIAGIKPLRAKSVAKGVGGPDQLVAACGTYDASPNDELKAIGAGTHLHGAEYLAYREQHGCAGDVDGVVVVLQQPELGKLRQIGNQLGSRIDAAGREEPPDVAPEEPLPG